MNETILSQKILEGANYMLSNQKNFFVFTSETNQSEWNISHHLANELSKIFDKYDCDFDVIKINFERKRPDIIFHKRGSNDQNFLVIEVKRDRADIGGDLEKIQNHWFINPLNYQYGAVVVINEYESPTVIAIKNSKHD